MNSQLTAQSQAFTPIYDYIPVCQAKVVAAEKSGVAGSAAMVRGMRISLEAANVEALAQMGMWDELQKTLQVS